MKNRRRVVTVDVVDDGLFAHEFEPLDSEKISRLKKLHHVVESDLTFISVQVSQHFNEHLVTNLL